MAFDYEALNLNIIGSEPIEKDNLDHWQQAATLRRVAFERWKEVENKRVVIDGVKYRLEKLGSQNDKTT